MMVQYLMWPSDDPRYIGGVAPADEPTVTHIAVALWVATFAVLVIPSLGPQKRRITEDHLLKAYTIGTTSFALL